MYRFLLVSIVVAVSVAIAGVFGGGWAAFGVLLFLVALAYVISQFRLEPVRPERAVWARPSAPDAPGSARRLIVVANQTLIGASLHREIRKRLAGADGVVRVVAPALNSRLRHWVSDADGALAEARARLDASLEALRAAGIQATGDVGDDDPVQALEDALRTFEADEVIISTHPASRSNWLERDVVERAREIFPFPITHVVVDIDREPTLAAAVIANE